MNPKLYLYDIKMGPGLDLPWFWIDGSSRPGSEGLDPPCSILHGYMSLSISKIKEKRKRRVQ